MDKTAEQILARANRTADLERGALAALDTATPLPKRAWTWDEAPEAGLVEGVQRIRTLVAGRGWNALNNHLAGEENTHLATAYRPPQTAALVGRGLRAIPGGDGRDGPRPL